jgi:hypothetical protein
VVSGTGRQGGRAAAVVGCGASSSAAIKSFEFISFVLIRCSSVDDVVVVVPVAGGMMESGMVLPESMPVQLG